MSAGLVPAPQPGQEGYFFRSDNIWAEANMTHKFLASNNTWKTGNMGDKFLRGDCSWSKMELIPQTESDFQDLTWAQIKALADKCVVEGKDNFTHMLGWKKDVYITDYGIVPFQLVALNNGTKTSGGTAGFTFMAYTWIATTKMGQIDTAYTSWNLSFGRSLLSTIYESKLPSDLKAVIAQSANRVRSSYTGTGTTVINDYLWEPSRTEINGYDSPKEGNQFDYFMTNGTQKNRSTAGPVQPTSLNSEPPITPYVITGGSHYCWLRTPGYAVNNTMGAAGGTEHNGFYLFGMTMSSGSIWDAPGFFNSNTSTNYLYPCFIL